MSALETMRALVGFQRRVVAFVAVQVFFDIVVLAYLVVLVAERLR